MSNFRAFVSRRVASVALALGFLLAAQSASAQTVHRSIDEFVAAQGTFCIDDGAGGCVLFVPPVANFVGNSQQVYLGLGVYGNGVLYVDQPENDRGLRYRNIHLGEAYWVVNHAGIVDTLYRCYQMSPRQMMQQKGWTIPEEILEKAKNPQQMDVETEILHCVYPRADYDPQRIDGPGKYPDYSFWEEAGVAVTHAMGKGKQDAPPADPRSNLP